MRASEIPEQTQETHLHTYTNTSMRRTEDKLQCPVFPKKYPQSAVRNYFGLCKSRARLEKYQITYTYRFEQPRFQ